ncbi:putative phage abortive infection protein [Paenibacillus guangzhouensis]|uniref:putative phage abortive infection protein n=1 Tax=Paenibacillus guangzhouensis TaxID=1473112 RepID=UPI00187B4C09|nr:putative phage abortive infection protein [Paenibacillus guangzhouensis]
MKWDRDKNSAWKTVLNLFKNPQFYFIFAILLALWGFANPWLVRSYFLGGVENYSVQEATYSEQVKSPSNDNQPDTQDTPYPTHKELGPIGDWLGGTSTPLLTLAGFLMILASFIVQRQQLLNSQKEVHEQKYTLGRQRFDSVFFNMVQLHNEIVKSMEYTELKYNPLNYTDFHNKIPVHKSGKERLIELVNDSGIVSNIATKQELMDKFEKLYNKNDDLLGHYFRNLYNLIKIIDESEDIIRYNADTGELDMDMTDRERKRYIRIIRAQLSFSELILIFFNSLTENGREFKELIEKHKLLNNLKTEKVPKAMRDIIEDMGQH